MWNPVFVEEIIKLMSIARVAIGQHAHASEFTITTKSPPSHDQRVNDCPADGGNFRQRAPEFSSRNVEDLGLLGYDSARTENRSALKHRYIAEETAFVRVSEVIFSTVTRFESFDFAA